MVGTGIEIRASDVTRMIEALASHGRIGSTGVGRLVYTDAWASAMELCREWAELAGLEVREDAVGNLWARLHGSQDGPVIATGSHIDSQCNGGRFDGALGVVGSILALDALRRQVGRPKRTLEAVVFCEEEGSRFAKAAFWGSRAVTGGIRPEDPDAILDSGGESIAEAMRANRLDPLGISTARRDDIGAFVELHIEQGPVCEAAGVPVAVVEAITGIAHFEVTLTGEQNHAGTCPMDLRRDPMAGFAEIASGLIDHAHRAGRPAVTTIGRCDQEPGGTAVVPHRVRFSIDARHPDPAARKEMLAVHERLILEVAGRRGLRAEIRRLIDHPPVRCDPGLVETLRLAADRCGLKAITMASGAGHDAQRMAGIAPAAMIFVRSKGGISHSPEENSSTEDCVAGIRVLAEALRLLAY